MACGKIVWTFFCWKEAEITLKVSKNKPEEIKKDENEVLVVESKESPVKFLIIAGQPLNEKIVAYGPFVLNSQDQLIKTFDDFELGQNGFEEAPGWHSAISKLSRSKSSRF